MNNSEYNEIYARSKVKDADLLGGWEAYIERTNFKRYGMSGDRQTGTTQGRSIVWCNQENFDRYIQID